MFTEKFNLFIEIFSFPFCITENLHSEIQCNLVYNIIHRNYVSTEHKTRCKESCKHLSLVIPNYFHLIFDISYLII